VLSRHGYDVVTAGDGPEAIEVVRRDGHRFDAVLLDLTMPQLSGEETLAVLRKFAPDLPVILTSGYSSDTVTVEGPRISFLAKPYGPADLYEAVRAAMA
jgi:CheY-like chemotaxis protein